MAIPQEHVCHVTGWLHNGSLNAEEYSAELHNNNNNNSSNNNNTGDDDEPPTESVRSSLSDPVRHASHDPLTSSTPSIHCSVKPVPPLSSVQTSFIKHYASTALPVLARIPNVTGLRFWQFYFSLINTITLFARRYYTWYL